MKKIFLPLAVMTMLLGACSSNEDIAAKEAAILKEQQEAKDIEQAEEVAAEESVEVAEEESEEVKEIDTSVYEYAKSVEVTNSIDITKHVNLLIEMSSDLAPGMAANHVLNQTFDFLQQTDLEGAETVTFNVTQDGTKIFKFTTRMADFKPDDVTPMANLVVDASELEFMAPAVEEFGKTMELW